MTFVLRYLLAVSLCFASASAAWAQEPPSEPAPASEDEQKEGADTKLVPELTYEQHPGLAYAASKIYFTDQKYSLSGFGEFNVTPYAEGKNPDSGDLELYYSGLYRFSTFLGYKLHRRVIFNFEFLGELLHDGTQEIGRDIVIEAMLDFMVHKRINFRFGYYPLPIGYINNNDEPVMFFSVNRPEVERLILPSSWISLGAMGFGRLPGKVNYSAGLVGGLNSSEFRGASWVRQGRQIHHAMPDDFAWVAKIERPLAKNLTAGVSGYRGGSSDGEFVDGREVRGLLSLGAVHAKYETRDWRLVGVATSGSLTDTEDIYAVTGEALGSRAYGYYLESGYDILPLIGRRSPAKRMPVFARYERLDTHARVAPGLLAVSRAENDLRVITVGVNYNPKRAIVFKGNYQFRKNFSRPEEGGRAEFGMGFVF